MSITKHWLAEGEKVHMTEKPQKIDTSGAYVAGVNISPSKNDTDSERRFTEEEIDRELRWYRAHPGYLDEGRFKLLIMAEQLRADLKAQEIKTFEAEAKRSETFSTYSQLLSEKAIEVLRLQEQLKAAEARAVRWIPVSERLPEKTGNHLVTFRNGTAGTNWFRPAYLDGPSFEAGEQNVIAWAEFPEPYSPKEEG